MLSALRSAFVFSFATALVALAMPGCSQQGEGERCDSVKNGDEDCDSGLSCVPKGRLLDKSTDRCCPPDGSGTSGGRCTRSTGSGSGGSSDSGSTAGGSSGSGGTASDTGGTASDTGGTASDTGGTDANASGADAVGAGAASGD